MNEYISKGRPKIIKNKMPNSFTEELVEIIKSFNVFSYVGFEGRSERLSCLYSVVFLSFFTTVIFSKSLVLNPMSCYVPSVPKDNGKAFMKVFDAFCWINGTNLFQFDGQFPSNDRDWALYSKSNHKINYYQWVPIILAIQCLLYYVPHRLWKTLCFRILGVDCNLMIQTAHSVNVEFDNKKRSAILSSLADEIRQTLRSPSVNYSRGNVILSTLKRRIFSKVDRFFTGKKLFLLFLLFKIVYATNALFQFIRILFFFQLESNDGSTNPFLVFLNLNQAIENAFPLVSFCYFPSEFASPFGHNKNGGYIGQCNLTVNILNSKMFLFLLLWTFIVSLVTVFSIGKYVSKALRMGPKFRLIKDLLRKREIYEKDDREIVKKFVRHHLKADGVLIIGKIAQNVNHGLASEVLEILYKEFKEKSCQ